MTGNPEGIKTIKLGIYFWTSNEDKTVEMPKKTCWDSGFVSVVSNNRHSIRSGVDSNFKNIDDIPKAIKDALKRSGVRLVSTKKGKLYTESLKLAKEAELISV